MSGDARVPALPPDASILVTGGSGFIASHCIALLLDRGLRVRTTVRSRERQARLLGTLAALGVDPDPPVEVVLAELGRDDGWAEAASGCDHVLHVASPLPLAEPRNDSALVTPARDGTLRVLLAARDAGVKRVVLTSSFAAIGYGQASPPACYDEASWTDPTARVSGYTRSKTLAERAGWDFIATEGGGLELATVNPVAVLGPVPVIETSASIEAVRRLLDGRVPACPRIWFGVVDVRDVADLHLRALAAPLAAGKRFLACAGDCLSVLDMAKILSHHLPDFRRRLPTRTLPDWVVRAVSLPRPELRRLVPELGRRKPMSNDRARQLLGWQPRPAEDAIVATATSLVRLGLVRA